MRAALLALALASPASAEDAFTYTPDLAEIIAMSAMTLDTPEAFNQALAKAIPDHPPLPNLYTDEPDDAYWAINSKEFWDAHPGERPRYAPDITCQHGGVADIAAERAKPELDFLPLFHDAQMFLDKGAEDQTGAHVKFPEEATGIMSCTIGVFWDAPFIFDSGELALGPRDRFATFFRAADHFPVAPMTRIFAFAGLNRMREGHAQTGLLVVNGYSAGRPGEVFDLVIVTWVTFTFPVDP